MKLLIDECVDWRLLRDLSNHDVKTVRQMGGPATVNGALLTLAEENFDVLLTTDKESVISTERAALESALLSCERLTALIQRYSAQFCQKITLLQKILLLDSSKSTRASRTDIRLQCD